MSEVFGGEFFGSTWQDPSSLSEQGSIGNCSLEAAAVVAVLTPRIPAELRDALMQVGQIYMKIAIAPDGGARPGSERGAEYIALLFDLLDAHEQDVPGKPISFATLCDRADALLEAMYGKPLDQVFYPANGQTAQVAAMSVGSVENVKDLFTAMHLNFL